VVFLSLFCKLLGFLYFFCWNYCSVGFQTIII